MGVNKDMPDVMRVRRSATTVAEIKGKVHRAESLMEAVRDLAEALPDRCVEATVSQVAAAAYHDLAQGNVLSVDRVRWAAGLLRPDEGWPALAWALELADPAVWWGSVGIEDILLGFREVSQEDVRNVLRVAGIRAKDDFPSCTKEQLDRLRSALASGEYRG